MHHILPPDCSRSVDAHSWQGTWLRLNDERNSSAKLPVAACFSLFFLFFMESDQSLAVCQHADNTN